MWAAEHYGVTPDILVFGKGVGGGFPLAGILASTELAGFQAGDEALTFGEFPVSLAAGLAALNVLKRDGMLAACVEMGQYASAALHEMKPRHPLIGDIRGPGLLIGIELVRDQQTKEPATAETLEVYRRAMDLGVIFGTTRYAGLGNVLKVKPPVHDYPRSDGPGPRRSRPGPDGHRNTARSLTAAAPLFPRKPHGRGENVVQPRTRPGRRQRCG